MKDVLRHYDGNEVLNALDIWLGKKGIDQRRQSFKDAWEKEEGENREEHE